MSTILLDINFLQKCWQWLNTIDTQLFLQINTVYTNSFLDAVYPWYREGNAWLPLYLFLVIFSIQNFKNKAFGWILFAVLTITLTDQISSNLIKGFFERPRPCRDPLIMTQVRMLLNGCSGGYSFTSSHATNHFGFAIFVISTIGDIIGKWKYALLFWAFSISYGQIYVGVHYPLDIFGGAILGCCLGYFTAKMHNRLLGIISC